jgi:hypothetical protein
MRVEITVEIDAPDTLLEPFDQGEYFRHPPKDLAEALVYFARQSPVGYQKAIMKRRAMDAIDEWIDQWLSTSPLGVGGA